MTDANQDLKTYKTAVSKFDFEKQRAKINSELVIQQATVLLSTCQNDFSNLTQICQNWEKDMIDQGKVLAEKDSLIAKGDENLKNCERLIEEKSTSIGTFESKLKDCNWDLNNCTIL